MRVLGASKLNPYGESILRMRGEGKSIAEILQFLKREGVAAAQSTVSDWLLNHPMPKEEQPPIGRPPIEPVAAIRDQHSFGLFEAGDDQEQFDRVSKLLRVLWLPAWEWDESRIEFSIGEDGFQIPLTRDGEPDFSEYARTLGRKRVRTLGDMDYVLLSMWTRKVRALRRTNATNFRTARVRSRRVLTAAAEIRVEMLDAVSPKRQAHAGKRGKEDGTF